MPFDIAGLYAEPGRLKNSVHIENDTDVVWDTPYARRWYYVDANFQGKGESENSGEGRGTHWVDRMMQNGGREVIEQAAREAVKK